MHIVIQHPNPTIDMITHALAQPRMNESGKFVVPVFTTVDKASFPYVLLSSQITSVRAHGVLVIAALPMLSVVRNMIDDYRHIAFFGTRSYEPAEYDFIRKHNVQCFNMIEVSREGLSEVTDAVMSYVRNWSSFHIILDINVLDPAFVPGLNRPVPAGMSVRELVYVLQRLRLIKTLASCEVIVAAEPNEQLVRVVTHIISELS